MRMDITCDDLGLQLERGGEGLGMMNELICNQRHRSIPYHQFLPRHNINDQTGQDHMEVVDRYFWQIDLRIDTLRSRLSFYTTEAEPIK